MEELREDTPSMSTPARYTHTPLENAGEQIRLLKFLPGHDLDLISCEISVWTFDEAPPYVAASYTWGSPADTFWITINEQPYEIRRNCYDALRQIRRQAHGSYVWADSICINQSDLDEKALQVGMMGDIFAKAQTVYCCIGDHADNSDGVFSIARDVASYVKANSKFYKEGIFQSSSPRADGSDPSTLAWQRLWALRPHFSEHHAVREDGPQIHRGLIETLNMFAHRPYWHRMWIIQEIYLSQRCLVLCGEDWVSFDDLVALMGACKTAAEVDKWWHGMRGGSFCKSPLFTLTDPIGASKKAIRRRNERIPIQNALRSFRTWECSDPRDRLYAMLGIVSWPPQCSPLKPDYRIPPMKVAFDALEILRGPWSGPDYSGRTLEMLVEALELRHSSRPRENAQALCVKKQG